MKGFVNACKIMRQMVHTHEASYADKRNPPTAQAGTAQTPSLHPQTVSKPRPSKNRYRGFTGFRPEDAGIISSGIAKIREAESLGSL